jgi:hypothetical protein
VDLVEVDVVGAESPQRRLDRADDVAPPTAGVEVDSVEATDRLPNLVARMMSSRRPLDFSAAPRNSSEAPCGEPYESDVSKRCDAAVDRGVDDRLGGAQVEFAAEVVAADADDGDGEAGRAEPAVSHVCHAAHPILRSHVRSSIWPGGPREHGERGGSDGGHERRQGGQRHRVGASSG